MQKIAIISSSKDPAGINIRNSLIESFSFEKTSEKFDSNDIFQYHGIKGKTIKSYLINDELIFADDIDKKINADILIFASKHRSKENTKSFAVHAIGNWSKAELGGKEKELCPSSAVLLKNLFVGLNNNFESRKNEFPDFEVTMEATHHGPYVEKPSAFIEIGSTEKEWNEKINGELIAKTIRDALQNENRDYRIAFGIGGPHYCSNFNKIQLNADIAISHVCPKYMLEHLDHELIKKAIGSTMEKTDFALLDWKGLGKEKQRIVDLLKEIDLSYARADSIKSSMVGSGAPFQVRK